MILSFIKQTPLASQAGGFCLWVFLYLTNHYILLIVLQAIYKNEAGRAMVKSIDVVVKADSFTQRMGIKPRSVTCPFCGKENWEGQVVCPHLKQVKKDPVKQELVATFEGKDDTVLHSSNLTEVYYTVYHKGEGVIFDRYLNRYPLDTSQAGLCNNAVGSYSRRIIEEVLDVVSQNYPIEDLAVIQHKQTVLLVVDYAEGLGENGN